MQYRSHNSGEESNNSFAIKVETLVREIIIQNEIPYYRIESGVEHLTHAGAQENLPVIRIITYFEDTVSKISDIMHHEFDVDAEVATDKKKIRIETFAYKNINYTARLTATRQNQTEYRRAGNKKFEIQICSMLQDAWTGIEKELGYDSIVVPDESKRDFYRVGALLEMADIEFLKIRTELARKLNKADTPQQPEPSWQRSETIPPQPVAAKEEPAAPKKETVDNNTRSFIEQLHAAAREVQSAPAPQPQVTEQSQWSAKETTRKTEDFTPNIISEAPKTNRIDIDDDMDVRFMSRQPIAEQPAYMPPPPPPVSTVNTFTPPPVYEQPPVLPQEPAIAAKAPEQAPKPATATSFGLSPKPINVPKPEPVVNRIANDIGVDNLRELANSINNNVENKNAAPKQDAPKEPVYQAPPPVISELPKPAPEVILPVIEKVTEPQQQAPSFDTLNNINNSIIQKATEMARDNNPDKTFSAQPDQYASKQVPVPVDDSIQMTDISLREFVMGSKVVKEIDQKIAERAGAKINTDVDIEGDVERLRFLKVYTLKQLQDRLTDNKEDVVAFAEKWIGKDNGGSFDSGICLFYLEYLLVGKRNDPAFAVEYVVKFISDNDYSARYIIPTYNSIHNTEAPNFSHLTLRA